MRAEVCRPGGGGAIGRETAQRARVAFTWMDPRLGGCGGRASAAERTPNIQRMSVTRDVSKLTGWLKASTDCRVESRACDEGRSV